MGARAQRLALGVRRERLGRDQRDQGVRARDGRARRTRPRREHVVGQRRRRTAAEHREYSVDQVDGRHAHRGALHGQLRRGGLGSVGASVLFPGPHMLRTGLFESWRNRPAELARLEAARRRRRSRSSSTSRSMADAGVEVQYTPVEEVADRVADAHPRRHVLDPAARATAPTSRSPRPGRVDATPAPTPSYIAGPRARRSSHHGPLPRHLGRLSRGPAERAVPRVARPRVPRRVRREPRRPRGAD